MGKLKHGDSSHTNRAAEYRIWATMKSRCTNPNNEKYNSYGGRGIAVCPRWLTYANFIIDMGRRPSPQHSLDRIDNNGNYEPSNCRWATSKEQSNNRRKNRWIEYEGRTLTLAQLAAETGIKYKNLWKAVSEGRDIKTYISKRSNPTPL